MNQLLGSRYIETPFTSKIIDYMMLSHEVITVAKAVFKLQKATRDIIREHIFLLTSRFINDVERLYNEELKPKEMLYIVYPNKSDMYFDAYDMVNCQEKIIMFAIQFSINDLFDRRLNARII